MEAERPDHLLPENRTRPQYYEQHWQQKDQTTYILRAENGHKWSGAALATERPDHLLPEGRVRPQMVKSKNGSRKTRPLTN